MDVKSLLILNCICLLILYFSSLVKGNAPYGFCANNDCSEPVSKGVTILRYISPDDNRISVEVNEEVEIYVKEYGPKKDLWGIVAKGNRGYISKGFIRETQLLAKRLVPATVEFKSNILVSESLVVSSNLQVSSSQPLQSGSLMNDVAPESFLHSQTIPQDFISTSPTNFQQNQENPSYFPPHLNPSENQQASYFASNLNPNENQQASYFPPNLNPSENHQPSYFPSNLNPSESVQFDSKLDLSSQFLNVPVQPSHFPSGHISSPPHASGVESRNILPSPTHTPYVKHSLPYESISADPLFDPSIVSNALNDVPNFDQGNTNLFQGGYSGPNSVRPSQAFPSQAFPSQAFPSQAFPSQAFPSQAFPSQAFPSQAFPNQAFPNQAFPNQAFPNQAFPNQGFPNQGFPNQAFPDQAFPSVNQQPSGQDFQSSYPSIDNFEADYKRTLAMLSTMGIDNPDMLVNGLANNPFLGSDVQSSSQNLNRDFIASDAELNAFSSQSQHQPSQSSDTSSFPSIDPSQSVDQDSIVNSHTPDESVDHSYKPTENINVEKESKFAEKERNFAEKEKDFAEKERNFAEKEKNFAEKERNFAENEKPTSEKLMDDENTEDDDDYDIIAEDEEGLNEGEEEDDEGLDTSEIDATTLTKDEINAETKPNLQSSMSSTQKQQQTSKTDHSTHTQSSITDSSSVLESSVVRHGEYAVSLNESSRDETDDINPNRNSNSVNNENSNSVPEKKTEVVSESVSKNKSDILEKSNEDAVPTDSSIYKEHTTPKINDFFVKSEQTSELDKISNTVDIDSIGDDHTTYQNRNLKGEFGANEEQHSDSDGTSDENNTQSDSETSSSYGNWFDALKAFVDSVMSWIPEPLYSALMDLQNKGISPRVPVFTALCGFICIFLIVPIICIKEWSKESRLTAQLASVEKDAYTLSATKSVLEEKLESVQSELAALQASLVEEKSATNDLKMGFENQEEELENAKAEIESCLQVIDSLKEKENEYLTTIQDQEKDLERFAEHKEALDKIMKDQENCISDLTEQLQESDNQLKDLEKEKEQFLQLKEDYEEKLAQFDKNCKQLLQEAEVWNLRVQQLTTDLDEERKMKEEFVETLKAKEEEIESLKQLVETFQIVDDIEDPEEQAKAKEEKLKSLLDSSMIVNQLKQEEEKSKLLDEQLTKEKARILDMEVEILDAKSEIDKLKMSYNQALQDKAEAQTKLDVLTNYFKDKEIQLQKQLGAQEAVRQKKEEDASSAERRICLIEQENASYKYQVASMKQEMEETERNLKSQIAAQEKKAHENWIAARAAERKLEDMKQEVTQLRQRLTLLEREQENWANASRDEVIRPVPKRMPGVNDESGNQDLNTSERGMFPHPPPLHDRLPPHMMLPPDRPLPPLPPPPIPPMFLPPMERHFRHQPWHMPPEHSSDYRTTPPEFMAGRESTPPRGRQSTVIDGDTGPHASSPLTTETRDSRNSTPPHLLPDFHDIPPQPGRPFFPPPPGHPRLPMHPPFRRDAGPGPKRLDHPNEFNSRGSQQGPPQEQWQHSRV